MTAALLAARLRAGGALTALLAKMPCAAQVESAGHAGFDLVVFDTEHGPAGGFELEHHLRAAQSVGLPALVRVPSAGPEAILAALDAGASGVVVPHVLNAEGARAVVAAAHYPPRGRRGFSTSTRAGGYGATPLEEHVCRAAEETCVVVQIEDAEAIPLADEILGVDGVSGVLIGAVDLSFSLGQPGSPPHREVEAAIDAVLAAAVRASVPAMAVVSSGDGARAWRARGATVIVSVSTSLIHEAFVVAARETRASLDTTGREPLVLLPGMLGDAGLWDEVAFSLSALAAPRVGRIDLDYSVSEMAASVLASAPDRFALAGHSLGAFVALEMVRQAPGRVTRLALLNASARPASDAQIKTWAGLRERTENRDFASLAHDFALANLPARRHDDVELVHRVEAMALAVGADGLLRQLTAQQSRPDGLPHLAQIGIPTLVLGGSEDAVCPPAMQKELADGIPGAEHITLDGVGHLALLEDPPSVAEHLAAWLAR